MLPFFIISNDLFGLKNIKTTVKGCCLQIYFVILHSNYKIMKKATTIEEQIKRLRDRNVTIVDEEKAKENLLDIGYYRLGFYFFPF